VTDEAGSEATGFIARLYAAARRHQSLVCVGLDPEPGKFPTEVRALPRAIFEFNRRIIDATAEYACCFKPQFAHYAALGAEDQLLATIRYVHEKHPGIPVILDSKRGDIGSTAAKYARESFDRYGADAVTVNPYLGFDSVEPCAAPRTPGRAISRTWSRAANGFIATWPSASHSSGTRPATACW
jgi:orotidine-5'-phosphate decarboxylase